MCKIFDRLKQRRRVENSVNDFNELWNMKLEYIWEIDNTNDFVIATYGYLCRKSNYGDNIEKLSEAEKTIYFVRYFEDEVNNGGIPQFLYNSSGDFSFETISALQAIGANKTASMYKKALGALGGSIPKNRNEREILLDEILTDKIGELLDKFDKKFYKYPDDLMKLNCEFILNNRTQFTE